MCIFKTKNLILNSINVIIYQTNNKLDFVYGVLSIIHSTLVDHMLNIKGVICALSYAAFW